MLLYFSKRKILHITCPKLIADRKFLNIEPFLKDGHLGKYYFKLIHKHIQLGMDYEEDKYYSIILSNERSESYIVLLQ